MKLLIRSPQETKPAAAVESMWRAVLSDYLNLMKPRITSLILIVTFASMLVADRGWPGGGLVAITLLGTTLAAGGANAINCYFDADIDAIMARTRGRPIPSRRITKLDALAFGLLIGVAAFVLLALAVNILTASIALGALGFYAIVYTFWLKRLTPQNIVIGGAAGAAPALLGWAAVTGELDATALALFAIIFYWTPPHFWALALIMSADYKGAGVPMLPVVVGAAGTHRQILLYSLLLFAITLILVPVDDMGGPYFGGALALGGIFVGLAYRLWRRPSIQATWALWRYSVIYLALLFTIMVADKLAA